MRSAAASASTRTAPIAPHLLGYVGAINAHEQKLHKQRGYGPEEVIGKEGVEQMFETQLRGSPACAQARGRQPWAPRPGPERPARERRQRRAAHDGPRHPARHRGLAQAGHEVRERHQDPGAGHASRPTRRTVARRSCSTRSDGSVVALASAPDFDVREFTDGIPAEKYKVLNSPASNYPLIDRALQGQYAPGSTWKLITAIAALESGTVTPEDVIQDRGEIRYENQIFKNAGGIRHGGVALQTAIAVSSDVYFYIQGLRLWEIYAGEDGNTKDEKRGSAIQTVARRFGFSRPTGVGLGSELTGRIPDEKFKQQVQPGQSRPVHPRLAPGDSINLAVGQGDLLVTPMQLGGRVRGVRERRDALRAACRDARPRARRREHPPRAPAAARGQGTREA